MRKYLYMESCSANTKPFHGNPPGTVKLIAAVELLPDMSEAAFAEVVVDGVAELVRAGQSLRNMRYWVQDA